MRGAVSSLPFTSSVGWGSNSTSKDGPQPGQELKVDHARDDELLPEMGIPLVKGVFTDFDLHRTPRRSSSSTRSSRSASGRTRCAGKHVWFDPSRKLTIVGVV